MSVEVYSAIIRDFGSPLALIIIIMIAIFAIVKLGVNFNLNDFLASRKERHRSLARAACPHVKIFINSNDEVEVQSLLCSPSGTLNWVCTQCGAVMPSTPSDDEFKRVAEYFAAHPDAYMKRMKKYTKHAKKSL